MTDEKQPHVTVTFTKSSQQKGEEGFTVFCSEGVTKNEAQAAFEMANMLRRKALAAIAQAEEPS